MVQHYLGAVSALEARNACPSYSCSSQSLSPAFPYFQSSSGTPLLLVARYWLSCLGLKGCSRMFQWILSAASAPIDSRIHWTSPLSNSSAFLWSGVLVCHLSSCLFEFLSFQLLDGFSCWPCSCLNPRRPCLKVHSLSCLSIDDYDWAPSVTELLHWQSICSLHQFEFEGAVLLATLDQQRSHLLHPQCILIFVSFCRLFVWSLRFTLVDGTPFQWSDTMAFVYSREFSLLLFP